MIVSTRDNKNFQLISCDTEEYPIFGLVSDAFGTKPVSVSLVKDTHINTYAAFVKGKIIYESCLLIQYTNSFNNQVGDDFIQKAIKSIENAHDATHYHEGCYCLNHWDSNYQHFILETLPKIYIASKILKCPIFVFDAQHVRELLECMFPFQDFIYISDDLIFNCERLYFVNPIGENFRPLTDIQISTLKHLRKTVINLQPCVEITDSIIYNGRIKTDGIAGFHRRITNLLEFNELIKKRNIHIDDFYGKTLADKTLLASKASTQITPIGANLLNYLFVQSNIKLYVIDHPYFDSNDYFKSLFQLIDVPLDYNVLSVSERDKTGNDWTGLHNSPYSINIPIFDKFLETLV